MKRHGKHYGAGHRSGWVPGSALYYFFYERPDGSEDDECCGNSAGLRLAGFASRVLPVLLRTLAGARQHTAALFAAVTSLPTPLLDARRTAPAWQPTVSAPCCVATCEVIRGATPGVLSFPRAFSFPCVCAPTDPTWMGWQPATSRAIVPQGLLCLQSRRGWRTTRGCAWGRCSGESHACGVCANDRDPHTPPHPTPPHPHPSQAPARGCAAPT